jgi:hypothetical protein
VGDLLSDMELEPALFLRGVPLRLVKVQVPVKVRRAEGRRAKGDGENGDEEEGERTKLIGSAKT